LVVPDHAVRLPVLRALSLCTCCRQYPGTATGGTTLLIRSPRVSLPRYESRVGPCIVLFEAYSAFTRVAACTLALSPYFVTRFTEGFSQFVTSLAAPVASGWSIRRVGLAPTGKAPPWHGAPREQTFYRRHQGARLGSGLGLRTSSTMLRDTWASTSSTATGHSTIRDLTQAGADIAGREVTNCRHRGEILFT